MADGTFVFIFCFPLLRVSRFVHRYPLLIDAVIQSNGIGFVGTDGSTMSEMAKRRCESWHGGVTRTVKWGHIGADDH
jgi:hypothetical protein